MFLDKTHLLLESFPCIHSIPMPDLLLAHLFALFRLMRLKFLLYSPLLYTVGILLLPTLYDSHVNLWQYFQGLFFVWVVHINTHFVNEYFDYEADVKNILSSPWTGGSKVLVAGLLRPETSLVAALITTAIAIAQALAFRNVEVNREQIISSLCPSNTHCPILS